MDHHAFIGNHTSIVISHVMTCRLGGFKAKEIEFIDILRKFEFSRVVWILYNQLYFTFEEEIESFRAVTFFEKALALLNLLKFHGFHQLKIKDG